MQPVFSPHLPLHPSPSSSTPLSVSLPMRSFCKTMLPTPVANPGSYALPNCSTVPLGNTDVIHSLEQALSSSSLLPLSPVCSSPLLSHPPFFFHSALSPRGPPQTSPPRNQFPHGRRRCPHHRLLFASCLGPYPRHHRSPNPRRCRWHRILHSHRRQSFSFLSQSLLNLSLLEPSLPTRRYSGSWYRCCHHSQTYLNIMNPICTSIPTTTTDHRKLPHNHSSVHSSQTLPLTSQFVPKLLHPMMEYSQVNLYLN